MPRAVTPSIGMKLSLPFLRSLRFRLFRLCTFSLCGLAALVPTLAAADATQYDFHLPAGPAEKTLWQFAQQAGGQFVFSSEKVAGVHTPAVEGRLSARAALERLVAGTHLQVVQDEKTGALTVDRIPAAPGSIEGRVFDTSSGSFLNNARVTIEALRLETFTDQYGQYQFSRVPAGRILVRATFTGLKSATATVEVLSGRRAQQDFNLEPVKTADSPIVLDAFTVAASRDMAASDVAVNEQRYATNIKNVVSTDSFGDIAEGSVGEFAKFLPGVTLGRNGSDGVNLSIGGLPPANTPITLDGNAIASASSSSASRTVELDQITITNMSRVEVTRSQNPDNPASAIGGSVNLVSRSAFERSRPEYVLKTYISFRGDDFSLSKQPNPFAKRDYPFEPNLELNAVIPLSKNFGLAISGLVTRALNNGQGTLQTWVPTIAGQSSAFPATTPDRPYLVRYRLQERPKITERDSTSLAADWRFSPGNVLTFGFQYAFYDSSFWVRQLNFDVGSVASFGADYTQGKTGAGFAQIITDARHKVGTTYMPSLRWKHNGPVWDWQLSGAFSRASNRYRAIDSGYFQNNNAYYRGLTIRFEQMGFDHPGVVSAKDAAGRDLDPYSLSNYKLESVSSLAYQSYDIVRSFGAFAKRDFDARLPLTLKTGVDVRSQTRSLRRPTSSFGFVGPDGLAASDDDAANQWYDPIYSSRDMLYGPKMQWFNLGQIGATYRQHPAYFSQTASNQVNDYRTSVTTSQAITEVITAPYVRLDTKALQGRLQLTGGVRYERTDDQGEGPLIDPTRIYQRDAAGNIVRDAAGKPVVIAPLSSLAGSQLAYRERGSHTKKAYGNFYPSLNGAFLLANNLVARLAYSRSISRPDFDNILPTLNLPDTESTSRTITLTNPALKPWSADSYSAALEYYFGERASGVVSTRVYRRQIDDFWGTVLSPATAAELEPWGLDPAVYGEQLGYMISTTRNVGQARVDGLELDYRQNLSFLPSWAKGFTVFGNLTFLDLQGDQEASFRGFVKRTVNWGLSYSRARFTARLGVNMRGLIKLTRVTLAGAEPGTYSHYRPRNSADCSVEYRATRQISIFASARNVNQAIDDTLVYGPSTPSDRSLTTRAQYGTYWNVGLKGTF